MTVILDAGAFVAVERGDWDTVSALKEELALGRTPLTHGGVVGQIWRGGSGRQANIARLLPAIDTVPLDEWLAKRAGMLLKRARMTDVIDAAVVLLAADGDQIFTSDPGDLRPLADAAEVHVDLVRV